MLTLSSEHTDIHKGVYELVESRLEQQNFLMGCRLIKLLTNPRCPFVSTLRISNKDSWAILTLLRLWPIRFIFLRVSISNFREYHGRTKVSRCLCSKVGNSLRCWWIIYFQIKMSNLYSMTSAQSY